jgi:hypothetical protein
MYNEGKVWEEQQLFKVISLDANTVADNENDLTGDKHCQLQEKCGYMVTKPANAHKYRKVSYKLLYYIRRYIHPL